MTTFTVLLLFLVVLSLAWGTSRLLARRLVQRPGGRLQLRESLPLGRDRALLLVQVGEQQWLIATTAQSVTLLQSLPAPVAAPAAERAVDAGLTTMTGFPDLLNQLQRQAAQLGQRWLRLTVENGPSAAAEQAHTTLSRLRQSLAPTEEEP